MLRTLTVAIAIPPSNGSSRRWCSRAWLARILRRFIADARPSHGLRRDPLSAFTTGNQLGDRGESAPLITSCCEHVTSWRPARRGVRRSIRVASRLCDRLIGIARRDNDRTPVIEGVVQRKQRRFVAAVNVARARKAGPHLVRQLTSEPERTGDVEELLQLCADVPEARRTAKGQAICPAQVIGGRNLDLSGSVDMCPPRRIRVDCFRRREFGYTT